MRPTVSARSEPASRMRHSNASSQRSWRWHARSIRHACGWAAASGRVETRDLPGADHTRCLATMNTRPHAALRPWTPSADQHRARHGWCLGHGTEGRSHMTEGTQQTSSDNTTVRAFQVGFPEAELSELRRRVNATRWPERETVTDDSQGMPLAMMQELAGYWGTDYDWGKCEGTLNALPNFITEIDGLDIHFI